MRGRVFDTMHDMEVINYYLRKADKPLAVGFERNAEHPAQIRFFDIDDKTVFLPDRLYREERDLILKSGILRKGRIDMQYWHAEAKRHALRLKMKRRLNKHVGNVISAFKTMFGANGHRR